MTSCCLHIHLFPHLFASDSRCSCRYVHRIGHHVCEVRHGLRESSKGRSSKKLEFSLSFFFFVPDVFKSSFFIHHPLEGPDCFRTQTNKAGSSACKCKQMQAVQVQAKDAHGLHQDERAEVEHSKAHSCMREALCSQLLLTGLQILCSSLFLYLRGGF